MGPPCIGKTTIARILHKKMGYEYINVKDFFKQYSYKNDIDRVNKLIKYLSCVPHKNVFLDDFFENKKTAQVFFEHFVEPKIVFHFDAPKDEVMENINNYYKSK